jgi:hypothetical protein
MTKKKKNPVGTGIALIFFLLVWVAMLAYSHWYFSTGWFEKNAIMRYCSQFNDTDLGWWKYIFGHGVLNFVAGYGAVFPLAVPIVALVNLIGKRSVLKGIEKIISLFFSALFGVVLITGLAYGGLYFMAELPLLSGFLLLLGVCCLIPTGSSILVIIVSD